ncbi:hypothetical protein CHS0354_030478 [Potamilus streckersoni]|uniref:Uncharacterized protein n=1 Tax=Potamilus streckersoni TaxID=2493646 RepID=A0AAE0RPG5_9BIVA|nr:hypothetical protein CHS0354_030478 [Potamilus streckersoni]
MADKSLKSVSVEGIKVSVCFGDLVSQKTNVVVCNTLGSLMLKACQASAALLAAGGMSLQDECSTKYPNGLNPGEIAEVTHGKLPCLTVYFVNIPMTTKGDVSRQEKEIQSITRICLEKASQDNMKTIAFAALGTGRTGYREDVVAKAILTSIGDFGLKNPASGVTRVAIVVHPSRKEIFKTFESEAKSRAGGRVYNGGATAGQDNKHTLTITMHRGKLADWKADALVCSCGQNMDLRSGGLARSLLETAGKGLQDECRKKYPSGIPSREVVSVDGIGLKCNHVFFGYLVPYNTPGAEQHMSDFISKCLELGDKQRCSSIAFPALGTGGLGFPPKLAAKLMRKSVKTFKGKYSHSSLESIDIVIYGGASNWKELMQAYKEELSKKGSDKGFTMQIIEDIKDFFDPQEVQAHRGHVPHQPIRHEPIRREIKGTKPVDRSAFATLPKIGLSDLKFNVHNEIGRGGFGVVYHGKWMGTDVAIKKMTLRVNSAEVIKMVEQEVSVHSRLRHPHIVQIMGVCSDPTSFYIISEFIDGSDLQKLIFRAGGSRLTLSQKFTFAKQCCQAVAYLHGVHPPIIHQDIKPSNVLVSKITNQAKICDFGISKIRSYSPGRTTEGTPYFMAPELLIQAGSSSFKSDIWALGCTFLELFTDLDLWSPNGSIETEYDIIKRMKKNEKPPALRLLDTQLPSSVRKSITDCLEYAPTNRPSALDLVNEFNKHA